MARVSRAAGSPPGSPSERRRVRFDTSTCMAVALMVILLRTSAGAVERVAKGDAARRGRARASHRTGSSIVDTERARLAGAVGDAAWDAGGPPGSNDPAVDTAVIDDDGPGNLLSNRSSLVANPTPANDDGTYTFPSDVSGTFKGSWRLVPALGSDGLPNGTISPPLPGMKRFNTKEEGGEGVVIVQLSSRWDPTTNVQWVRAELAVRDGSYVTSQDKHLRMRGVYVEPTGMVQLVSESTVDHSFKPGAEAGGSDGAADLGDGASNLGSSSLGSSYREALRVAARDVVGLPFTNTLSEDVMRPENVPGSTGLSALQRGERLRRIDGAAIGEYPARCKFELKMRVKPGAFKPIDRDVPGPDDVDDAWDSFGELGGAGGGRHGRHGAGSKSRRMRAGGSKKDPSKSAPGEGGKGDPSMLGVLRSEDCGYELQVRASWFRLEDYYRKAMNYSLMIIFTVPAQIYLLVKQTEYSATQSGMAKISLACVGMQAVLDSYQCLMHLTAGIIVETLFHSFSTAAFFQFTLFSVFEMRVLLQIWKSRRPNTEQTWLEIRRDLSSLYSRFYGGFLLGFMVMYWCADSPWLIALACNSYWLPQIAWSAWHNGKKPLMPAYVLGTSAIRLLVPLYVFGCPENFVRIKPQFWVCWLLIAWVGVQVALLAAQHALGPRCFIPDKYLPEVYDYHRTVEEDVLASAGGGDEECGEAGGVDCVICMNAVEAREPRRRMVTPCNHFFHQECLERWMDVKMECPTCRGALPPL